MTVSNKSAKIPKVLSIYHLFLTDSGAYLLCEAMLRRSGLETGEKLPILGM